MIRRYCGLAAITALCAAGTASAENFGSVSYDAKSDQLVVTMLYRGTNADHEFSLQWGECKMLPDGTTEIVADVLDSQARDAAREDFRKTVRLSLGGMANCRPATLTLRAAPRSYFSMPIPAAP
jgi:hypothetical protein